MCRRTCGAARTPLETDRGPSRAACGAPRAPGRRSQNPLRYPGFSVLHGLPNVLLSGRDTRKLHGMPRKIPRARLRRSTCASLHALPHAVRSIGPCHKVRSQCRSIKKSPGSLAAKRRSPPNKSCAARPPLCLIPASIARDHFLRDISTAAAHAAIAWGAATGGRCRLSASRPTLTVFTVQFLKRACMTGLLLHWEYMRLQNPMPPSKWASLPMPLLSRVCRHQPPFVSAAGRLCAGSRFSAAITLGVFTAVLLPARYSGC